MLKIKLLKEVKLKRGSYNLVAVDNASKVPNENFKDALAIAIERLKRKYGSGRFVIDMTNNIRGLALSKTIRARPGSIPLSLTTASQIKNARNVALAIQKWILKTINDFPFMVIDPNEKNIYYRGMSKGNVKLIYSLRSKKLKGKVNAIAIANSRYRSVVFKTGFDVDTQSVNIFHELIHYFDHHLPLDDILKNNLTPKDAQEVKKYLRKKRYRSKRGHIETGKLTFLNDKNLLTALFGSAENFKDALKKYTKERNKAASFARSSMKKKVEILPRAISLQQFLRDKHKTDKITVEMINDLCKGKYDDEITAAGKDEDLAGYLYVFKRAVCKDENKKRKAADALNKIAKTATTDQTTMVAEQQKLDKHR